MEITNVELFNAMVVKFISESMRILFPVTNPVDLRHPGLPIARWGLV